MVEEQAKQELCVKQATNSDFVLHSEDSKAIKFSVL
jgi:hypothetical protein